MESKSSHNIIFIEANSRKAIVRNFDNMLRLLDEDWFVEEEVSGPIFIMSKLPKNKHASS